MARLNGARRSPDSGCVVIWGHSDVAEIGFYEMGYFKVSVSGPTGELRFLSRDVVNALQRVADAMGETIENTNRELVWGIRHAWPSVDGRTMRRLAHGVRSQRRLRPGEGRVGPCQLQRKSG